MSRLIAGTIGFFLFGVIVAEIINNFDLFDFKLKVYWAAVPLAVGFLFHELIIKNLEHRLNTSIEDTIRYKKIIAVYYAFLWIIGLCALLATPFLWWGLIKGLAILANEGKLVF